MRLLVLALLPALSLPLPASAQPVLLFSFEGPGGDTEGWTPDANSADVRTVTSKPIGMGQTIGAYEGDWMLDAGVDGLDPLPLSTEWRAITRVFPTRPDLSSTPLLRFAASGYAFGPASSRHEFRITVTGAGAAVQETFVGFKDDPGATFVNAWQVLELDLSGFPGAGSVEEFRVEYRNADDGTDGTPSPSPWGGRFQIDAVTARGTGLAADGAPQSGTPYAAVRPNPASASADLTFSVETGGRVRAALYDALGREVRAVYDGDAHAGTRYTVRIETATLPPGLYLCRVVGDGTSVVAKLLVAR